MFYAVRNSADVVPVGAIVEAICPLAHAPAELWLRALALKVLRAICGAAPVVASILSREDFGDGGKAPARQGAPPSAASYPLTTAAHACSAALLELEALSGPEAEEVLREAEVVLERGPDPGASGVRSPSGAARGARAKNGGKSVGESRGETCLASLECCAALGRSVLAVSDGQSEVGARAVQACWRPLYGALVLVVNQCKSIQAVTGESRRQTPFTATHNVCNLQSMQRSPSYLARILLVCGRN